MSPSETGVEPMRKRYHLAVVDDDESLNRSLVIHLEERGDRVSSFTSGTAALDNIVTDPPDLVLLDVRLKDMNGIDVLRALRERYPETSVVIVTAFHESAVTVEATRLGASDYIAKPLHLDQVDKIIDRALARRTEMLRSHPSGEVVSDKAVRGTLVGKSAAMLEVFKTMGEVTASDATVLLLGESGTGKELVARAIHAHSGRTGPFLSVNCAMLTEEFLGSELFGHERGAFTGATDQRRGTFELANGGTLLLDEVSEMDPSIQAKLLRVLQERTFERLGGSTVVHTDVRVIAATNRDLQDLMRRGLFREDVYFRLAVLPIRIPPLRERREDIPPIVEHFLRLKSRGLAGEPVRVSAEAMKRLVAHEWRGNVRELENAVTSAGVRARGGVILADDIDLPPDDKALQPVPELRSLEEVEHDHIAAVLRQTTGHKARAAQILGVSRPTLDSKLKRYGITVNRAVVDKPL